MENTRTSRGFALGYFEDRNGVKCSIQKSSVATDDLIWLGCNAANPHTLVRGKGWVPLEVPSETVFNERMHLDRATVAELIPMLQHFVDTGDLP